MLTGLQSCTPPSYAQDRVRSAQPHAGRTLRKRSCRKGRERCPAWANSQDLGCSGEGGPVDQVVRSTRDARRSAIRGSTATKTPTPTFPALISIRSKRLAVSSM